MRRLGWEKECHVSYFKLIDGTACDWCDGSGISRHRGGNDGGLSHSSAFWPIRRSMFPAGKISFIQHCAISLSSVILALRGTCGFKKFKPFQDPSIKSIKMSRSRAYQKSSVADKSLTRHAKRKRDEEDIAALEQRINELDPEGPKFELFAELPICQPTVSGLKASHYKKLTEVQQVAIPLALQGRDILGAAKTGSGKTLSFLIPVLDNLYRKRWTELDGLGALILSPTRELAIQIFEVLRKIGRYHTFSAGLVIGGKSLQEEQERLGRMNILVCTPGRMLQHLDQTSSFESGNLQMLVLDEADRIMDMGFQGTVDAIVEHLPKQRQTLLFSATQTKKVSDLARLSLDNPVYVSIHQGDFSATPSTLKQHYIITPLPEKLDTLWSFIRANVKSKILVFLSSGKQVRFVYESFRHLQPGIPLLHLHGRQKQSARLEISQKFSVTKNACLFATDVVARGMDFPAVDWVIQLDCPEDADTYIHRVGRTARYERDGRAVLFLEPSEEEGMLKRLENRKVPIEMIKVKQKRQLSIRNQLQNMCFKDPALKYLGQKAFVSYVRSIHVQKDKEIFRIDKLPLEEFSASLGLPGAPRIKFHIGGDVKEQKNARENMPISSGDESRSADETVPTKEKVRTKYDRMFERRNHNVLSEHYTRLAGDNDTEYQDKDDGDEDNNFLKVKRRLSSASESDEISTNKLPRDSSSIVRAIPIAGREPLLIDSNRLAKLLKSKKAVLKHKAKGKRLVYDDEGNAHEMYELEDEDQFKLRGKPDVQRANFVQTEAERVRDADVLDKQVAKQKKKDRKEKRKARAAMENEINNEDGSTAVLAPLDGLELNPSEMEMVSEPSEPRAKKWFENKDEEVETKYKKARYTTSEGPETLENLEALATEFLS